MNLSWIRYLPAFVRNRIEGRYNLQKIIHNTGWLFADKILRMVVGLFVAVWLARYLGPQQFGTLSYAIAFVALFGSLATLGLDKIVVRNIVHDPSNKDEILGTAFILKFICGLLTIILVIAAVFLLRPDDVLARLIVAVIAAGLVFKALDVIEFWFESQVKSKFTVYAKNAAYLTIAGVQILLILFKASLIAFAWAALVEAALGALGLIITYKASGQLIRAWRVNFNMAKELLSDSWPLILSSMAVMIYMRIDLIMLGELSEDKAVGIYNAATRISEVWYFIPVAIVSSVFPSIIRSKKINEHLYLVRLQQLYDLMVWLAIVVAIPITYFADDIISLLYGSLYSQAGTVLAIHIWAAVFVFMGVASGQWFLAENRTQLSFRRVLAGGIINIILNLILIPMYSINGAAIATLISQALAAYFYDTVSPLTRNMFYMKTKSLFFINSIKKVINA